MGIAKKLPPLKKKPQSSDLMSELDRFVARKAKLLAKIEDTKEHKELCDTEKMIEELVVSLKELAVKKGDFETKFYRFTNVDRRNVDYKKLMEELVSSKKATPQYLAKFIRTTITVQATLLKENTSPKAHAA